MSQQQYHHEDIQLTEAQRIASQTTARQYFLTEQSNLVEQWGQKSLDLFKFMTEVFMKEYQIKSSDLVDNYGQRYEDLYSKCRKEFEAYCILNRKVQKKSDEIENFAAFFNAKNHQKTFFNSWKAYSTHQKHLRSMQQRCQKYKQTRTLRTCLKSWNDLTMKANRMKIKNDVLHKTQIEITSIQQEYQKVIRQLEETLQKKLTELKKQQEEHKLLHDKYESMYARNKAGDSAISQ